MDLLTAEATVTTKLNTPLTEEVIKKLKVGDMVEISGTLFTARDAVHQRLHSGDSPPPVDLNDQIIYHCGPIVIREGDKWIVKAAGPTTSARQEPYEYDLIKKFGIRGLIGKGGMGDKTLKACHEFGCVYFHTVGGAAQILANRIKKVKNVYLHKELGDLEAIWEFEVEDFPAVVTMDAHGHSLHKDVFNRSVEKFGELIK